MNQLVSAELTIRTVEMHLRNLEYMGCEILFYKPKKL